jgi:hypothetical protein
MMHDRLYYFSIEIEFLEERVLTTYQLIPKNGCRAFCRGAPRWAPRLEQLPPRGEPGRQGACLYRPSLVDSTIL